MQALQSGLPLVLAHPKHFAAEALVQTAIRIMAHQSVGVEAAS
jgi:hypothetical protein